MSDIATLNQRKLLLLILLSLLLLSCGIVQKVAEPIDRSGCKIDCRKCEFSKYIYATHECFCLCNGVEVQLY